MRLSGHSRGKAVLGVVAMVGVREELPGNSSPLSGVRGVGWPVASPPCLPANMLSMSMMDK